MFGETRYKMAVQVRLWRSKDGGWTQPYQRENQELRLLER